jgi:AraC-like DNA-binding protein
MRASSGVWHTGGMSGNERIKGFQLWVAMPPALELAEPESQYLKASDLGFAGPARVIAGEYDGVKSIVGSPSGMTYLDVRLKAGERWTYQPPRGRELHRPRPGGPGTDADASEPLSSIAVRCGMCDQPHFTRSFQRIVGETPYMWRRARQGSDADRLTRT